MRSGRLDQNACNVIDSNELERDLYEKPETTFSHPALCAALSRQAPEFERQ